MNRRPVSQQRYWVRRAVALLVVSLVLVGLVRGASALFGGDGEDAAGDGGGGRTGQPATSAPAGDDTTVATSIGTAANEPPRRATPTSSLAAAATTAAPSTAAAATPDATGPPTAQHPARVLVVGDSDAGTFGPYLEQLLDETGVVETTVDYKVSSGLARPDFFDWPAHLRATLPRVDPDIVVVTFGGNDAQGLARRDGSFPREWNDPVQDRDAWSDEYQRRVLQLLDILGDRTIIWVGIPNDDNPDVTERMGVQDGAAKLAVAQRDGVTFVDTWTRFSGRSGGWAEFVVDPRDGVGKDVRADDGFHLNETGAEILALDIATLIRDDLVARGADL